MSNVQFKDVNGLRLVRNKLPIGTSACGDLLSEWAQKGYTEMDNDLAKHFKCHAVFGSVASIANARKHLLGK